MSFLLCSHRLHAWLLAPSAWKLEARRLVASLLSRTRARPAGQQRAAQRPVASPATPPSSPNRCHCSSEQSRALARSSPHSLKHRRASHCPFLLLLELKVLRRAPLPNSASQSNSCHSFNHSPINLAYTFSEHPPTRFEQLRASSCTIDARRRLLLSAPTTLTVDRATQCPSSARITTVSSPTSPCCSPAFQIDP